MFQRLQILEKNESFFLFGPRGTGKSTLLKEIFASHKVLWFDLLNPVLEDQLSRNPEVFQNQVLAAQHEVTHVVIDEVQKIPKLLNIVHFLIENTQVKFVLTGSSSRKLKRGASNLLAGRAIVFELQPLSALEIGNQFNLNLALSYGTLPKA